jgi:3',5'-cyclic-AMP phosphodiesterase
MANDLSRREMLRRSAVSVAAVVAGGWLGSAETYGEEPTLNVAPSSSQRVLRFAHPTDIHVQPERGGGEGMAAAFRHMMALKDPPQMILTGGDLPMDIASTEQPRSAMLWKLFKKVLADEVPSSMPIHHAIGNHDIWGRDKDACNATGKESFFGKRWFLDEFGYSKTYYSYEVAGWHFIVLDSFDLDKEGPEYTSRIVGEQLDWLKADLRTTAPTTPIVLLTHVPIISAANFFDRKTETDSDITVLRTRMHVDYRDLDALFVKHRNVKLCLSGHLHLLDKVEYNGVTHICDGAVCGDKWKGPRQQTPEGYGLIDLYADGSFSHQYVSYGWRARGGV